MTKSLRSRQLISGFGVIMVGIVMPVSYTHLDVYKRQVDNHLRDYKDDTQHTLYFRIVRKDGEIRWIAHSCNPIFGEEGNFLGRRVSNRDITARKLVEEQLEKLSQTDSLTGLANRRHFMILAEHELSRAVRYSGELSLLMMDIDHFKAVNDTYGHQTLSLIHI